MRQIKFKVWNGDYFEFSNFNFKTGCLGCNFSAYVEIDTPQQFTGEISDVGIDIYEGDIISKTAMIIGDEDITGIVEFLEGQYWISDGENSQPLFSETALIEVLGNIHENPDLLGLKP